MRSVTWDRVFCSLLFVVELIDYWLLPVPCPLFLGRRGRHLSLWSLATTSHSLLGLLCSTSAPLLPLDCTSLQVVRETDLLTASSHAESLQGDR